MKSPRTLSRSVLFPTALAALFGLAAFSCQPAEEDVDSSPSGGESTGSAAPSSEGSGRTPAPDPAPSSDPPGDDPMNEPPPDPADPVMPPPSPPEPDPNMPDPMMPDPIPEPPPPAAEPPECENAGPKLDGLKLLTVATADRPIHLVGHPTDRETAFVAERGGAVRIAKGLHNATTAVELSAPILEVNTNTGGERGLLSLALHPDDPKKLYVFFNDANNGNATTVEEFSVDLAAAKATRVKQLYQQAHSAGNHQGGNLTFGADKMLYFSVGDNGGGGRERALALGNNYGKILRMDPATGMAPEGNHMGLIYAYGLRNPFRISTDQKTGHIYIGDVGEGTEEVNVIPAGKSGINFGWSGGGNGDGAPLVQYTRQNGFAVIGGYVYRGTKNGCMYGRYFFSDRSRGPTRSVKVENGEASDARSHAGLSNNGIYSFGEDGAGELYMLYGSGGASGRIARIVEE